MMLYKKYWDLSPSHLTQDQLLEFEREVRDNENVILIKQNQGNRFAFVGLIPQHGDWATLEAKNITIYTIIQLLNIKNGE